MEFTFDVRGVLPNEITRNPRGRLQSGPGPGRDRKEREQQLATIIDKLGAASAKAQGLRVAITTYQKVMASSHTLYLLRDAGDQPSVVGLLKVGRKKLYLSDPQGVQRELEPLCVLDFYIHESRQRLGLGRRLFETMLRMEGVRAAELAIDRPSTKFLSFLRKHYRLHSDVKQGNNFVVFSQFFQDAKAGHTSSSVCVKRPPANLSNPASTLTLSVTQAPSQPTITQAQQSDTEMRSNEALCTALKPSGEAAAKPALAKHTATVFNTSTGILTPKHQRRFPAGSGHNSNFNWSPDVVLMRQLPRANTRCDIISGAPLITSSWKLSQTQWWKGGEGEGGSDSKAPLLTMRDKDRSRQSARRKLGNSLQGYHLAGQGLGTAGGAYSRHSTSSMQPSSHTFMLPAAQKSLNFDLEPRPDRWKQP